MSGNKIEKICEVCGDVANARNFGALTCQSCKSFFRRHAFKRESTKCSSGGICVVNVKTRTKCMKCRIDKCYSVGMKKEIIRIRCDNEIQKVTDNENSLQIRPETEWPKSVDSSATETSIGSQSSDENSDNNEFVLQLIDNTLDISDDELNQEIMDIEIYTTTHAMKQISQKLTIIPVINEITDYNGLNELAINRIEELINASKIYDIPFDMKQKMKLLKTYHFQSIRELIQIPNIAKHTEIGVKVMHSYVNGLNGFMNICFEDQLALFKYGFNDVNFVRAVNYYNINDNSFEFILDENTRGVISFDLIELNCELKQKYNYKTILKPLQDLCEDKVIHELILSILLFSPNRQHLTHRQNIILEQQLYIYLLQRYLLLKYRSEWESQTKLQTIMKSLSDLQVFHELRRVFEYNKYKQYIQNYGPLIRELYDNYSD